jgi:hypothetical protein
MSRSTRLRVCFGRLLARWPATPHRRECRLSSQNAEPRQTADARPKPAPTRRPRAGPHRSAARRTGPPMVPRPNRAPRSGDGSARRGTPDPGRRISRPGGRSGTGLSGFAPCCAGAGAVRSMPFRHFRSVFVHYVSGNKNSGGRVVARWHQGGLRRTARCRAGGARRTYYSRLARAPAREAERECSPALREWQTMPGPAEAGGD